MSCRTPSGKCGILRRSPDAAGQLHLSFHHLELVAHVVVLAGKLHGRHAAVIAGVLGHGVGQLDLTAGTGFGVGQQVVDLRG